MWKQRYHYAVAAGVDPYPTITAASQRMEVRAAANKVDGTEAALQYQDLMVDLLRRRAVVGGLLPQEEESKYAAEFDRCWDSMSDAERADVERIFGQAPGDAWDAQIVEDISAGRLDVLAAEAIADDRQTVPACHPLTEHREVSGDKRIVSLSVFGDSRFGAYHWQFMPRFLAAWVRAHHALFPGYELRIHHDHHLFSTNYGGTLCGLSRRGLVKLVYVPARPGMGKCEAMLWRLVPLWDS